MQAQTGQLEDTSQIRLVRRDIARLLTEDQSRNQH
jgi:ribosomal protein L29